MVVYKRDIKRRFREGSNCVESIPKRAKVHAQRKFAQGLSSSSVTEKTFIKEKEKVKPNGKNEPIPLLSADRPKTEDFLTYLCFRNNEVKIFFPSKHPSNSRRTKQGTPALPSRLDYFNAASGSDNSSAIPTTSSQASNELLKAKKEKMRGKHSAVKIHPNQFKEKTRKPHTAASRMDVKRRSSRQGTNILRRQPVTVRRTPRSVTRRPINSAIHRRITDKRLRAGLRSGGRLPAGSDAGLPSVRRPRSSSSSQTVTYPVRKSAIPLGDTSDEEEDDEEEDEDDYEEEKETRKQVKEEKHLRARTRSSSIKSHPSPARSLKRLPSRKTKEAAAAYMEILNRSLRSPVVESDSYDEAEDPARLEKEAKRTGNLSKKLIPKKVLPGRSLKDKSLKRAPLICQRKIIPKNLRVKRVEEISKRRTRSKTEAENLIRKSFRPQRTRGNKNKADLEDEDKDEEETEEEGSEEEDEEEITVNKKADKKSDAQKKQPSPTPLTERRSRRFVKDVESDINKTSNKDKVNKKQTRRTITPLPVDSPQETRSSRRSKGSVGNVKTPQPVKEPRAKNSLSSVRNQDVKKEIKTEVELETEIRGSPVRLVSRRSTGKRECNDETTEESPVTSRRLINKQDIKVENDDEAKASPSRKKNKIAKKIDKKECESKVAPLANQRQGKCGIKKEVKVEDDSGVKSSSARTLRNSVSLDKEDSAKSTLKTKVNSNNSKKKGVEAKEKTSKDESNNKEEDCKKLPASEEPVNKMRRNSRTSAASAKQSAQNKKGQEKHEACVNSTPSDDEKRPKRPVNKKPETKLDVDELTNVASEDDKNKKQIPNKQPLLKVKSFSELSAEGNKPKTPVPAKLDSENAHVSDSRSVEVKEEAGSAKVKSGVRKKSSLTDEEIFDKEVPKKKLKQAHSGIPLVNDESENIPLQDRKLALAEKNSKEKKEAKKKLCETIKKSEGNVTSGTELNQVVHIANPALSTVNLLTDSREGSVDKLDEKDLLKGFDEVNAKEMEHKVDKFIEQMILKTSDDESKSKMRSKFKQSNSLKANKTGSCKESTNTSAVKQNNSLKANKAGSGKESTNTSAVKQSNNLKANKASCSKESTNTSAVKQNNSLKTNKAGCSKESTDTSTVKPAEPTAVKEVVQNETPKSGCDLAVDNLNPEQGKRGRKKRKKQIEKILSIDQTEGEEVQETNKKFKEDENDKKPPKVNNEVCKQKPLPEQKSSSKIEELAGEEKIEEKITKNRKNSNSIDKKEKELGNKANWSDTKQGNEDDKSVQETVNRRSSASSKINSDAIVSECKIVTQNVTKLPDDAKAKKEILEKNPTLTDKKEPNKNVVETKTRNKEKACSKKAEKSPSDNSDSDDEPLSKRCAKLQVVKKRNSPTENKNRPKRGAREQKVKNSTQIPLRTSRARVAKHSSSSFYYETDSSSHYSSSEEEDVPDPPPPPNLREDMTTQTDEIKGYHRDLQQIDNNQTTPFGSTSEFSSTSVYSKSHLMESRKILDIPDDLIDFETDFEGEDLLLYPNFKEAKRSKDDELSPEDVRIIVKDMKASMPKLSELPSTSSVNIPPSPETRPDCSVNLNSTLPKGIQVVTPDNKLVAACDSKSMYDEATRSMDLLASVAEDISAKMNASPILSSKVGGPLIIPSSVESPLISTNDMVNPTSSVNTSVEPSPIVEESKILVAPTEEKEAPKPKPKTSSIGETWIQAFKRAKIPKPGQLSPFSQSVKPFVRKPFVNQPFVSKQQSPLKCDTPEVKFKPFDRSSLMKAHSPSSSSSKQVGHPSKGDSCSSLSGSLLKTVSPEKIKEVKHFPAAKTLLNIPTPHISKFDIKREQKIDNILNQPVLPKPQGSRAIGESPFRPQEVKKEDSKSKSLGEHFKGLDSPRKIELVKNRETPGGKHQNLPLAVEHTLRKMSPVAVSRKPANSATLKIPPKESRDPKLFDQSKSNRSSPSSGSKSSWLWKSDKYLNDSVVTKASDLELMAKKKVSMTQEEIEKWLDDSTSTGIEHSKGCGLFEKNQCECSFRTSGSSMQNSVTVLNEHGSKVGRSIVEPPMQLKDIEPKCTAETISTCKVEDYKEKLISKSPISLSKENKGEVKKDAPGKPKQLTPNKQDKNWRRSRSMTEEEMCDFDFRFERNLNSPRESASDMSSPTPKDEISSSNDEGIGSHQSEKKSIFQKKNRPVSKSPCAFNAENESSVYAFEPDSDLPVSRPLFRRKNKTGIEESDKSGNNSIAVQVYLEPETVLETSTQTDQDEEENSATFYIPLPTKSEEPPQIIEGVTVKLDSDLDRQEHTVTLRANFVTKATDLPKPPSTSRSMVRRDSGEGGKPEQKMPPVGTVQPTLRTSTDEAPPPLQESPQESVTNSMSSRSSESTQSSVTPRKATKRKARSPRLKSPRATPPRASSPMVSPPRASSPRATPPRTSSTRATKASSPNSNSPRAGCSKATKAPSPQEDSPNNNPSHNYRPKPASDLPLPTRSDSFPKVGSAPMLVDAPAFYPSEKEFADPLEYLEKITPEAEPYGICRIVPPLSFKPECKVSDDMRFTSYNQYVHKMMRRWGPNVREMTAIRKFLATQNIVFKHPPWVGGMEIDLPRLYQTVQDCGGLKEVMEKKRWNKVADCMKIPKLSQDRATKLDDIYCKYLLPYDTLAPNVRDGLLEQAEKDWQEKEKKMLADAEENSESEDDFMLECITKGRNMPLSQFYRIARNTMCMCFGNEGPPENEKVEAEYWNHVTERTNHLCVNSGSIDCGTWGYGFPTAKNSTTAKHPWNLKVLTNHPQSVLRSLPPLMGVTVPTLHVGMLFSTFCWYRDPHGLPWIEYLHTGANKIWYGVPDEWTNQLRGAIKSVLPSIVRESPVWLPSDTAMLSPQLLLDKGVSLCRTVQEPGQFIVIFPKAYTSAFCTGYLVSESVYYAPSSWLATAEVLFKEVKESCEPTMFSLEKLLFFIANDARTSLNILLQIYPMVEAVRNREVKERKDLQKLGLVSSERLPKPAKKSSYSQMEYECNTCRSSLFISLVSDSNEDVNYCLSDAADMLTKEPAQLPHCKLLYMYDEEEMEELVDKVKNRIDQKSQKKNCKGGSNPGTSKTKT